MRDELEDHLRSRVDDLLIAGQSEREAVRKAVEELGETVELARRFRAARATPIRRSIMHATLFAVAGAVVAAAVGTFTSPRPIPPATPAAALVAQGEAPAPADTAAKTDGPRDIASVVIPVDTENDIMMGELLEQTAEANGLRLYVAWGTLSEIGIQADTVLEDAPTKGVSLGRAIELFAPALGVDPDLPMDAFVENGLLYVSSAEDVAQHTRRTEKYDASGLVAGSEHEEVAMRELVELIQNMVAPNGWVDLGGDEASINIAGTVLYVSGPARTHAKIDELLASLADDSAEALMRQEISDERAARERDDRLHGLMAERDELRETFRGKIELHTRLTKQAESVETPPDERPKIEAQLQLLVRELAAIEQSLNYLDQRIIDLRYASDVRSGFRNGGRGASVPASPTTSEWASLAQRAATRYRNGYAWTPYSDDDQAAVDRREGMVRLRGAGVYAGAYRVPEDGIGLRALVVAAGMDLDAKPPAGLAYRALVYRFGEQKGFVDFFGPASGARDIALRAGDRVQVWAVELAAEAAAPASSGA